MAILALLDSMWMGRRCSSLNWTRMCRTHWLWCAIKSCLPWPSCHSQGWSRTQKHWNSCAASGVHFWKRNSQVNFPLFLFFSNGSTCGCCWKYLWWWWWLFPHFCEDFWRMFNHPFPACIFFFFFFKVEISSHTLIPLFMPGSVHSSSASWDDCGRMFPDKLHMSSFPDRFPQYAWTVA